MIPILMWMAAAGAGASCNVVEGDRVTAADLAKVLPAFAEIAPETVAGYSPEPGAHRLFEPAELTRFAEANGVEYRGLATVCFERAMTELEPSGILAAIRESLSSIAITDADVDVIEYSKYRVPPGKLVFPIDSLPARAAANIAIWKGFVERESHRYPVWARVRIAAPGTMVVAAADLRAGQALRAGDVELEQVRTFPARVPALKSLSDGAGMLVRRYVAAGTPLTAADLMEPNDVDRGEMVAVEVQSGGARLKLEAQAETSGRRGQSIPLRNATSGKIFYAQIAGKGRALLECPSEETEK
jgi:flagella basal body P-ring formation protein FlgA